MRTSSSGISQSELDQQLGVKGPDQKAELMQVLNTLIKEGRAVVGEKPGEKPGKKTLVFRLQSDSEMTKMAGLSASDRLVYQEIEKSAANGIAAKDLKTRSGLQQQAITKTLKTLEARMLVRKVKSVAAKNKILYMLFGLEPSKEITGGAFYNEAQEFDYELVDQLRQISLRIIANMEGATAKEVHNFIVSQGILNFPIQVADVKNILQSLVYAAKVELVRDALGSADSDRVGYRSLNIEGLLSSGFTCVPCVTGPATCACYAECNADPGKCSRLTRWLEIAAEQPW